tara:strand:- start:8 stop:169 length:162 start_codon:yes stop_codon:yes gene_type:complete
MGVDLGSGLGGTIASKVVTYDFARLMEGYRGGVLGVWYGEHRQYVNVWRAYGG